jgi:hypothetical protein
MKPQDAKAFGEILGATMMLYEKDVPLPVATVWFKALAQFELADIAIALERHVKDPDAGRFAPKPADVIAHLAGGSATRSLRAWTLVEKAVRMVGHYRSVCFDDPITNKLIDDMGGWVKLASTATVEDLKFRGLEFQKRYTGLMQTGGVGDDYPAYLIGAAESHNAIENMRVEPPCLIGDPVRAQAVLERAKGHVGLRVTQSNVAAITAQVTRRLTGEPA